MFLNNRFFINFGTVVFLLVFLLIGHSYYVDSFDYWGDLRKTRAINNPHWMAYNFIFEKDFDCLIVGSSRGQGISPYQLSEILDANCVNLSVGGATSSLKQLYIKTALQRQSLRYIFYVSDFYEFFDAPYPDEILYHSTLLKGVKEFDENISEPGTVDWFVLLLDQVRFNRDSSALGKMNNKEYKVLGERGEKPSFRLDKYKSDEDYKLRSSLEVERDIVRDFTKYKNRVWRGEFDIDRFHRIKDQLVIANRNGISVNFILTPFHPKFNQRFNDLEGEKLKSYKLWKKMFHEAGFGRTFDLTEIALSRLDGSNKYWDDGVHLTKFGMSELMEQIFKEKN
jgi:hypothetical protein